MKLYKNYYLIRNYRILSLVISLIALLLVVGCKQRAEEPKGLDIKSLILTESNIVGEHHAERAFDKDISPDRFWESTKFPIWLQMDIKGGESKKIKRYSLQAGESTARMPMDWQFQGSNDGKTWAVLDIQINQTGWKQGKERIYNIAKPSAYKSYRLYFTKGNEPEILRIYEIKIIE